MFFLTHADVGIDLGIPITDWGLSEVGRARVRSGLSQPWLSEITSLWSSSERKAIDTAEILSGTLGLPILTLHDLGENDRSSTGYLPLAEFERTADAFFAEPDRSVRGWATARAEQSRILAAIETVRAHDPDGCPLVVSHGAVGALLLAHLLDRDISRELDQPRNGGGNWFALGDGSPRWSVFGT